MKKEITQKEDSIKDDNKKVQKYSKLDDSHSGTIKKLDNPAFFHQIRLDLDSTLIEVSDYMKNGGNSDTHDEWPWKVMKDSAQPTDKWITESNKGWILYQFDKAISIRGYGLKSASDSQMYPERDPMNWEFYIQDAVGKTDQSQYDAWILVDEKKDVKFTGDLQIKQFPFPGGQRIVRAIKLNILSNRNADTPMIQLNQLIIYS